MSLPGTSPSTPAAGIGGNGSGLVRLIDLAAAHPHEIQPAPLLPHRLAALAQEQQPHQPTTPTDEDTPSLQASAAAASPGTGRSGLSRSPTINTEEESADDEQSRAAQLQLILTALKTPASTARTVMAARSSVSTPAGAGPRSPLHYTEEDEDEDHVEEEQRLYARKSPPSAASDGKGSQADAAVAPVVSPAERERILRGVLETLNKSATRAYAFGVPEQLALSESIRDRALDAELSLQHGSADRDIRLQRAAAAAVAAANVSDKDVVAHLTSAPLLYIDSAPISPPHPNAPVFAESDRAKRVYQQMIQALFIASAAADYSRSEVAGAGGAVSGKAARKQRERAPGVLSDSDEDSDDDSVRTVLSSRTLDALAAHAKDNSQPPPVSPLDPAHPQLKSLLLTVEDAFDMPDRLTKSYAAPFRTSMRSTLALTKALLGLHQQKLDAHPTHTIDAFDSVPLFNTWFELENAQLNRRMVEVEEQMEFERKHRGQRPGEEDVADERKVDGAGSSATANGTASKSAKKTAKKAWWACCGCGVDEPDIDSNARMQSKPSGASTAGSAAGPSVDTRVVTQFEGDNFAANFDLLLQILLQHEHTLEAELDREEAQERAKRKASAGAVQPSQIDYAELKHPDEEAKKEDSAQSAEEAEFHAPVYTSRTVNEYRVHALSPSSVRLLQIYSDVWRVSKPHACTQSLALLSTNLNFNEPSWYSCCTNQLRTAQVLYRAHLALTQGSSAGSGKRAYPWSKLELFTFQHSVRDIYEWVALSLQRYQLVFARTREQAARDGDGEDDEDGRADADSPGGARGLDAAAALSAHQDGLRECLHLFVELIDLMKLLNLSPHTRPEQANSLTSPVPASAAERSPAELLRTLAEQAIATRYRVLVADAVASALVSDAVDAAAAASTAAAAGASSPPPLDGDEAASLLHVSQLHTLLKSVSAEVVLDLQRATVFREVIKQEEEKEAEAGSAEKAAPALLEQPAVRPPSLEDVSSALPSPVAAAANASSGFDLAQISGATYLSFAWRDTQQFLSTARARFTTLMKLPHRNASQISALRTLESQLTPLARVHTMLVDLYVLVSRSVSNLPDLRGRVSSWWEWAISAWLARTQEEWGGAPATGSDVPVCKLTQMVHADPFLINLGDSSVRYSSSLVELFAFLQPLCHTFQSTPFTQANVEELARVLNSVVSNYVRVLHGAVATMLDKERRKQYMWGAVSTPSAKGNPPQVELTLPQELFVRLNDIYLCRSQLLLLLDEVNLAAAWNGLLPLGSLMQPKPVAIAALANGDGGADDLHSPAVVHSTQSPALAAAEMPSTMEKEASSAALAMLPVRSPVSTPDPRSPTSDLSSQGSIPPAVLNLLECRPALDLLNRSVDDLLLRMTAGLGAFSEHEISALIWRESVEEWTGRHTKEEIEPLLAYLQKHLDHMRAYLYDFLFSRLLFFVVSDIVLILEKELVHPRRSLYKHRLRTEQVHRCIQLHYILIEFFEVDFKLAGEYMARLKTSHLNRLEFLETLLTGGSDGLVREFEKIDPLADDALQALPFAEREAQRLLKPPYLSRRQIAGIIKFRNEFEGDHSVQPFLKAHKQGLFSANYFQ